ncbi:MAG: hypothetical protein ACI92Z_002053 [Paracoccaceae bacterium]|jgi:hypothetical protein
MPEGLRQSGYAAFAFAKIPDEYGHILSFRKSSNDALPIQRIVAIWPNNAAISCHDLPVEQTQHD